MVSNDMKESINNAKQSLSKFNGMLYAILFFTFIVVTLMSLNIYYEFRYHICAFSNVRKCVASDKFCSNSNTVQSDQNFAVEYLTNQTISINLDLNNVTNQSLLIDYYNYDTTTENIGTSVFSLDLNFTDSVPSTGVSNIQSLGPSAGYNVNSNGVSIYLYPFSGKTITGISAAQIDSIISAGMSGSPLVAYLDEPLEVSKGEVENSGVVFISDISDYQFQTGTYILQKYANANPKNLKLTSTVVGTSSLFNNFASNNTVAYQETVSDLETINISEIIKMNNYKSRQNCTESNKSGCICIDPVLQYIPNCKNYAYDSSNNEYNLLQGKNSSPLSKVKFCSYLSDTGTANNKAAIQNNVPASYNNIISKGKNPQFYANGYQPNNPISSLKVSEFKSERYQRQSVFCSNVDSLTGYNPVNNDLYASGANDRGYSNAGTSVWNSTLPNGKFVGNTVNLGHPFR